MAICNLGVADVMKLNEGLVLMIAELDTDILEDVEELALTLIDDVGKGLVDGDKLLPELVLIDAEAAVLGLKDVLVLWLGNTDAEKLPVMDGLIVALAEAV